MKNTTIIITAIVVFVLMIGGILYLCNKNDKEATDTGLATVAQAEEIEAEDTQFVELGDVKRFSNDDGEALRSRMVYDRYTKTVYYVVNGQKKISLTPYIVNGRFAFYDEASGEIKECM